MKRDRSKEGKWRLRRKTEKQKGAGKQTKYMIDYLGESLTPDAFRAKYCTEFKLNTFLMHRKYSPAEVIVRYNAKYTPIIEPDVDFTWSEVYNATRVYPTRAVKKAKADRERKENKNIIERKLFL
jgi:hypothetical protein